MHGAASAQLHGFREMLCSETCHIGGGDYFAPYAHLLEVEAEEGEFLTDRLGREAADFVARHAEAPFFLYLSFYSVHTGLAAPKETVAEYEARPRAGKRRVNPVIAAMLEHLNAVVGQVLTAIEAAGVAGYTLGVFLSGNGGEHTVTTNAPLRGGKSQVYEGSIRVPMVARLPMMTAPGGTCGELVYSIDILLTFHRVASVSMPGDQPVAGSPASCRTRPKAQSGPVGGQSDCVEQPSKPGPQRLKESILGTQQRMNRSRSSGAVMENADTLLQKHRSKEEERR